MTLFKLTLARAMLAVALLGVSAEASAGIVSDVDNKSDLGINLPNVSINTEGKGDCDCAENLYGSSAAMSGFHKGYGEDVLSVIVTPAAAPSTAEIISVPAAKAIRKKLKRIAMKDGASIIRRKAGSTTACVFGAPNASGCRQN